MPVEFYNTGTATVSANGTAVTGQGTLWTQALRPGDLFGTHVGAAVRIASVNSNTSLTLAYPWKGPAQTAAAYEVQLTLDAIGYQQQVRELLVTMASGNLEALAELVGGADKIPYFTGPGVMGLLDRADIGGIRSINGKTDEAITLTFEDVGASASDHVHADATHETPGFMSVSDKGRLDSLGVSPWQEILDLAKRDGWRAVYDPGNPNTISAINGRVSSVADGLGNLPPLTQSNANLRPGIMFGGFGSLVAWTLDGNQHLSTANFSPALALPNCILTVAHDRSAFDETTRRTAYDGIGASNRNSLYKYADDTAATVLMKKQRYIGAYSGEATVQNNPNFPIDGKPHLYASLYKATGGDAPGRMWVDGADLACSGITGANSMTGLRVGNNVSVSAGWVGLVGPLIIFDGEPSAEVRKRMERLLLRLSGIQISKEAFAPVAKSHPVFAFQGVCADETRIWTSQSGAIRRYDREWNLQQTRNTTADGPGTHGQVNGLYLDKATDRLYVGANNYPNTPHQGWIFVYDAQTLDFITSYALPSGRWSEGAVFWNGYWWEVNASIHEIRQFDTSFNLVADHALPDRDPAPIGYYWNGIVVINDVFYINHHEWPDAPVRAYRWTGSGFEHVSSRLRRPDNWCTQSMYYDGTHVWWNRRTGDPAQPGEVVVSYAGGGPQNIGELWPQNKFPGRPLIDSGDWTPTLVGHTNAGNHTYSYRVGTWYRIGDLVYFQMRINLASKDPAATGVVQINGLPFEAYNYADGGAADAINVYWAQNFTLPANFSTFNASAVLRRLNIHYSRDNGGSQHFPIDNVGNTFEIRMSGFYRIKNTEERW